MVIFLISAAVTIFLLVIAVLVMLPGSDPVEARLMEVSAYTAPDAGSLMAATPSTGVARIEDMKATLWRESPVVDMEIRFGMIVTLLPAAGSPSLPRRLTATPHTRTRAHHR